LLDGEAGQDLVISGHRDTHFRFLKDLKPGDRLNVQTKDRTQHYEVIAAEIVDSRTAELVIEPGTSRISLVTCYPFDAPLAGGPLRWVVTALPVGDRLFSNQQPRSPSSG
jgi:sortase A